VADLIRSLFPAIPTEEVGRAAAYVGPVGSVRDWRAGGPSAEQMAVSAVRQFVRDKHTGYSSLPYSKQTKDAEERVKAQIDTLLSRWAGGSEQAGAA
jgi:hypothetical protein